MGCGTGALWDYETGALWDLWIRPSLIWDMIYCSTKKARALLSKNNKAVNVDDLRHRGAVCIRHVWSFTGRGYPAKGPYPPCLHISDRALWAGHPRGLSCNLLDKICFFFTQMCWSRCSICNQCMYKSSSSEKYLVPKQLFWYYFLLLFIHTFHGANISWIK